MDASAWEFPIIERASLLRCGASVDGVAASWAQLIGGLRTSAACRTALTARLVGVEAKQVFWETPALSTRTMSRPFEFVAIPCGLSSPENPAPFRKQLASATDIAVFANLRGDATLVVPSDLGEGATHNYLLSFLRTGSATQIDTLWRRLGDAIDKRLSDKPVWVSTSGGGVSWLHIRLDDSPKYYSHTPYRASSVA